MAAVGREKAYEKYAWVIQFAMGLIILISTIAALLSPAVFTEAENIVESLTGAPFSQIAASSLGVANYIYYLIRVLAFFGAAFGASVMVVSATAYRRAEVWAWYLTWLVPMIFLLDLANDYVTVGNVDAGSIVFVVIPVVGLLLPYRKFFRKK